MSVTERDVIVVGAGPAGAATAAALAQKGYDVLLLDRHQFPRDKTCGDAVPAGAIELLWRLGMREQVEKAVDRGELYPVEGMLLVSPRGHELHAKFNHGAQGADSYVALASILMRLFRNTLSLQELSFVRHRPKPPLLKTER